MNLANKIPLKDIPYKLIYGNEILPCFYIGVRKNHAGTDVHAFKVPMSPLRNDLGFSTAKPIYSNDAYMGFYKDSEIKKLLKGEKVIVEYLQADGELDVDTIEVLKKDIWHSRFKIQIDSAWLED